MHVSAILIGDSLLEMKNDKARVAECTTSNFEGYVRDMTFVIIE